MSSSISLYALDAENGDCILLVNNSTGFTVLIDAGPKSSSISRRLVVRIESILNKKEVDLAIVTHNDDDHIGGFKSFLNQGLVINQFIFNHHDVIHKVLNKQRNIKVSLRQDIELEKLVSDKVIPLNMLDNNYFATMSFDAFTFKFRSPNKAKLELYSNWITKEKRKARNRKVAKTKDNLSISDHQLYSKDDSYFVEDNREPNGSSLALDVEFYGYRILLLGDAHPTPIVDSYANVLCEKYKYDLIKISHHGSAKNTNNKLLKLFDCENFLICSNADNNHNHPSPTTVFRIINCSEINPNIFITKNSVKVKELENRLGVTFIKPETDYLEFKYEF